MMNSEKLQEKGFGGEILISLIIPNTYQMFWNISCGSLVDRLIREHEKFWTRERLDRADSIGLSPAEVYTLASIVDRETIAPREKPTVAGVYLNRLKKNMLLQADPTVVYATIFWIHGECCTSISNSIRPTIPTSIPDCRPDRSESPASAESMPYWKQKRMILFIWWQSRTTAVCTIFPPPFSNTTGTQELTSSGSIKEGSDLHYSPKFLNNDVQYRRLSDY